MNTMSEETATRKYNKNDWDEVRVAFSSSLMVDTRLISLAQNVELKDWPIKGEGETPSKYIDFTWEEINELPGLADRPERIDLLISILKETMAFDDPFGEMVNTVENATERDDTLERTLASLGIPRDCPLRFGALSSDTLDFCEGEGIKTIGQFASFSENMAQNVVVGGDFKALLNALMSQDHLGIARFLPYRPHEKGLHLMESVGLLVSQLSDSERYSMLKRLGYKLNDTQAAKARLSRDQLSQLEEILMRRIEELVEYFKDEVSEVKKKVNSGTRLERCFVVLNDEEREVIGAAMLSRVLKSNASGAPADEAPRKRGGFFSKLFGRS